MKMTYYYITLVCLMFSISFAQELAETDSVYVNAWKLANSDDKIDSNERSFLDILAKSRGLNQADIQAMEIELKITQPDKLDQSGRWPLVAQNMVLGASLYGWGVPTVFGDVDGQWYIGSTMLSVGGAFYYTHQYTQNMEIDHARSQMMRNGALVGLRFGFALNTLFNLHETYYFEGTNIEDAQIRDTKNEKIRALMLMAAVPAGIYLGDKLYQKDKPSNGDAWTLGLTSAAMDFTVFTLYNRLFSEPEEYLYRNETNDWGTYKVKTGISPEYTKWKNRRIIAGLASYPCSYYLGTKFNQNKMYTFGDALMLYEAYAYGLLNSLYLYNIFLENSDIEFETLMVMFSAGAAAQTYYVDRLISKNDFTFGQSILMNLGSLAGMAFGAGLGVIGEVDNASGFSMLALLGEVGGAALTYSILDVAPNGSLMSENASDIKFNLNPTFLTESTSDNGKPRLIPGLSASLRF